MTEQSAALEDGSQAPPGERLPLRTRLAFGAGDLGPGFSGVVIGFFQAFFLTTVAGLGPGDAGLIVLIGRFWDALTDPLMGVISDRSRFWPGRRRFWILVGALPFSLFFAAMWYVPPFEGAARFFYFLVVILLFNTAFTVVNVPYTSLTAELTSDYDERTTLTSFRFFFSIGGSMIGGILHGIFITMFCADPQLCLPAESQRGYLLSGIVFGLIMLLPFLWCVVGTRERGVSEPAAGSFLAAFRQVGTAFSNRAFLFVVGIYLCSWTALQVTQNVITFYLTFYLQRGDMFPLILTAVQGSALIFLFVWSAASRKIGKKNVYYLGMSFWILVQAGLFFLPSDQFWLAVALAALAGVGVATAYIVPWSMLPDVTDLDELQTGERREGIFYGVMSLLQKTGVGVGVAVSLQILELSGFDQNLLPGQQPDSALLALRWMLGPVPTLILLLGILLVYFYPISRQRHSDILAELAVRRRGES
jgi:GPH family glycoside/pentoside/hexuronide:cation symporter